MSNVSSTLSLTSPSTITTSTTLPTPTGGGAVAGRGQDILPYDMPFGQPLLSRTERMTSAVNSSSNPYSTQSIFAPSGVPPQATDHAPSNPLMGLRAPGVSHEYNTAPHTMHGIGAQPETFGYLQSRRFDDPVVDEYWRRNEQLWAIGYDFPTAWRMTGSVDLLARDEHGQPVRPFALSYMTPRPYESAFARAAFAGAPDVFSYQLAPTHPQVSLIS